MGLLIIYLVLALGFSFLCSILEAVLLSVTPSFISMKENEGAKNVKTLRKLKTNIDQPLSAILSVNTIAHTVGAAGVGAQAAMVFDNVPFGIISAVLTILILVFSEIIPKTIGASYWRSLALGSAPVIKTLILVCYPLVWISELLTKIIAPNKKEATVSREEVSAMLTMGVEQGTFNSRENKVYQNFMRLETIKAKDVLTPRVVVTTASEDMTLQEFYDNKEHLQFSRIPIYSVDNKDNITGYVLRQNVFEHLANDDFTLRLGDIAHDIIVSSDNNSLTSIWEDMLTNKDHIIAIVDEYGSFVGIVTMEDIIETIFGFEILDEKDNIADMQQYAREQWANRKEKYKHL